MDRPFARSYWVVPGQVLAGAYPDVWAEEDRARSLDALLRVGIRTVINLTEASEASVEFCLPDYAPMLARLAEDRRIEVECQRWPVRDFDVPTVAHMRAILDRIDAAVATGKAVYLHCRGGYGRTGTVVGCYLVRHGLATPAEALAELQRLRRSQGQTGMSPQTDAQGGMVRGWQPGE